MDHHVLQACLWRREGEAGSSLGRLDALAELLSKLRSKLLDGRRLTPALGWPFARHVRREYKILEECLRSRPATFQIDGREQGLDHICKHLWSDTPAAARRSLAACRPVAAALPPATVAAGPALP